MKEDAIRYIIYERKRRATLDAKTYNDFVQKYPLTVDEAFSQAAGKGIGDIRLINMQLASLRKDPPLLKRGRFSFDENWNVEFKADEQGPVIIYEHPNKGDIFYAGCDPADHDDVTEEASDMSLHIIKKPDSNTKGVPLTVLEFVDRPQKAISYYNQVIAALLYFNKAKILIERNRYRMISYFDEMGFKHLMATTPQGVTRLVGGRTNVIGIHMNETIKEYITDLISNYIDDWHEYVWSKELLQECVDYGTRNTDRVISFGLTLMLLKENNTRKVKSDANKRIPSFSLRKVNGRIVRVQNRN
jgi:hypothetical protein